MGVQGRRTRAAAGKAKVYSIPAVLNERQFAGSFEVSSATYKLVYVPARAEVVSGKLQVRGRLTIVDASGRKRERNEVRATLEGIQGGLGAAPVRRQILAGGAQTGTTATPEQKQQLAGETEKKPDVAASSVTVTEYTGAEGFAGVLYFRFETLDSAAFGVAADLSRVQLNARLAPTDETARQLRDLYSLVSEALYGDRVDERFVGVAVRELNRVFAA